jgi:hypothetical protein
MLARHSERGLRRPQAARNHRAGRDRPLVEHDLLPGVRRRELISARVLAHLCLER